MPHRSSVQPLPKPADKQRPTATAPLRDRKQRRGFPAFGRKSQPAPSDEAARHAYLRGRQWPPIMRLAVTNLTTSLDLGLVSFSRLTTIVIKLRAGTDLSSASALMYRRGYAASLDRHGYRRGHSVGRNSSRSRCRKEATAAGSCRGGHIREPHLRPNHRSGAGTIYLRLGYSWRRIC